MVRARSDLTFSESLGIAASSREEEGQRDEMDHRKLNKQMVKDSCLLTNIQEILHSLQGTTVFSSRDACGAYHAVRIKPGSLVCMAFISSIGTFLYIQMHFGLANTGSLYSRMLDVAMKEVDRNLWTGTSGHHTWMIS